MSERIGTKKLPGTADLVNPQFHEEFVTLCSLYFSGEICEEDWALLQIHMGYCDACHERFLQYQRITSKVIPVMAAVAAAEEDDAEDESMAFLDAAEQRLMNELDSIAPRQDRLVQSSSSRIPPWTLAAVFAVVLAGLATVLLFSSRHHSPNQEVQSVPAHELPSPTQAASTDTNQRQELQHVREENAHLQEQLNASEDRFKQKSETTKRIQEQLEEEQAARKQTDAEKDVLNNQLVAAQAEATSLRAKGQSGADSSEQMLRMTALESKVKELRTSLDEKETELSEKDRMLALDKDFLAHDRDIRDVIGARNLYIADIYDTTASGRTAKQFGRLFYTKDRSLVFYGFDLDSQAGKKQDVSFQVWGSGSDRPAPVSLGLFYQDDTHKRWVLRCNDSKSLARLDMVFVTVEPHGGSSKPTGKPLLRAYLQIQPNHP